ncbi:hypothetical protein HAX54_050249 [Datura stramonium]|uniref:Uncharacterized protein n=1 Tax=Datura stramonium TaxID=4076 RepID=A0ABS8WQ31_DATST|nr:hypothetical protein [Datura stramonium]
MNGYRDSSSNLRGFGLIPRRQTGNIITGALEKFYDAAYPTWGAIPQRVKKQIFYEFKEISTTLLYHDAIGVKPTTFLMLSKPQGITMEFSMISRDLEDAKYRLLDVSSLINAKLTFTSTCSNCIYDHSHGVIDNEEDSCHDHRQGFKIVVLDNLQKLSYITELTIVSWFIEGDLLEHPLLLQQLFQAGKGFLTRHPTLGYLRTAEFLELKFIEHYLQRDSDDTILIDWWIINELSGEVKEAPVLVPRDANLEGHYWNSRSLNFPSYQKSQLAKCPLHSA